MTLDLFEQQIFFATARITISNHTGPSASIGTGFLMRVIVDKSQDRSSILLVSNRHVFGNSDQRIMVNFHRQKMDAYEPELGEIVTLDMSNFGSIYFPHSDPSVDLACLNVSFLNDPPNKIYYKSVPDEIIVDFNEENLFPGLDVWFVGYPENRFDIKHNLPILRRGYIASIPTIDFNGRKQFIIDAQVFPGSSGSPVFTLLNGKFKLVGVVSETMIRNEQLQPIPATLGLGVQQILGLGIVTKATLVRELIDQLVEKARARIRQEAGGTGAEE